MIKSVLKTIDTFCYKCQWCMNVDIKGPIVRDVIGEHKLIVELGGYYGCSAVMFSNFLKNDSNSMHYTIEINFILACVIKKMTTYTGLSNKVRVLIGNLSQNIKTLKNKCNISQVDMLLDHIKDSHLPEFLIAEERYLVHKYTVIAANNVITSGTSSSNADLEIKCQIKNAQSKATELGDLKSLHSKELSEQKGITSKRQAEFKSLEVTQEAFLKEKCNCFSIQHHRHHKGKT
ncbi:putative catechol O-methyltransferase [Entomophthora muscae]|uniref:Catechol O-methyltransferase n=1 Tax=Entomophthora muscae TaxID=34485 RepID=A0ACC2U897_9FUNG|nr:putative catechol O-methyltransferase [Entomophthora muscae]